MARTFVPHHISDDSALGGSVIKNSLRFNSGDVTHLIRTPSSAGNRRTMTYSFWLKRVKPSSYMTIISGRSDGNNRNQIDLTSRGGMRVWGNSGGSVNLTVEPNNLFRDPSAWYHFVIAIDTTQSTASNRIKYYVNGTAVSSYTSTTYPSQNYELQFNNNVAQTFGLHDSGPDVYFAEINFIDGIALDSSYFGYTDFQTGIWRPKKYEGSYNTNGFHLEFKNTSTTASYTVPTASFTTDSDTALLINNNESNGSTTFTDSSSNGHSVSGTGGVSHSTAQAKFGTSSIIFDGSDDSLTVGGNGTLYSELTASSNKTYEAFVYHSANDYTYLFSHSSNQQYLGMYLNASSGHFGFNGNQPNPYTAVRGDVTIPLNQWNHFFVQRNADGTMTVGFNGSILQNSVAEAANNSTSGTTGPLKIGSQHYYGSTHRYFFEGYMDEIRISNTPRYSAAYVDSVGDDTSGQGNNFVPNNFQSSDVLTDAPTNNFATLDVLAESGGTYSEGNLKVVSTSDPASSNIGFASGKFYYEAYINATSNVYIGVIPIDYGLNPNRGGDWQHGAIAYRVSGQQYKLKAGGGSSSVSASYGDSYTAGDIIGCAVDIDNDTVTFYKNGTSQGNTSDGVSYITATGTTSVYGAFVYCNGGNNTILVNFGQDSTFQGTVSAGGNKDASGLGDFKYPVPSGYKALCSNNLPVNITPTILKPEQHFTTVTWTGDGTNDRTIPVTFRPDFVWLKARGVTYDHRLWNTLTPTHYMFSNTTGTETTTYGAFNVNDDGIRVWASVNNNNSSQDYVAWCWKAGGAAVTNNDGTITSSVSANTEAGFSIVSYTGNETNNATVGHGLGKSPDWVIIKDRDSNTAGNNWYVFHSALASGHYVKLNQTSATAAVSGTSNGGVGSVTSTTFNFVQGTTGNNKNVNENGDRFIAYCWSEIPGYSKFGSYTGNGNANGPYVHLGFRPAWIAIKISGYTGNWIIFDNKRDPFNYCDSRLFPNLNSSQSGSYNVISMLSDGFKFENQYDGSWNRNSTQFIYMAFAEQSGVSAYGTETNAR